MKTRTQLTILAILILCCCGSAFAQASLNDVKIGQCSSSAQIKSWIASEESRGLVVDSRPFAINQSRGKLLFTKGAGRVSVVHMNPFVYDYKISVAQQELVSTAVTDFLKLLLPQSLGSLPGLQSGEAGVTSRMVAPDKLKLIEQRLATFNPATCNVDPDACAATAEMFRVFTQIRQSGLYVGPLAPALSPKLNALVNSTIKARAGGAPLGISDDLFTSYTETLTKLRNEQLDSFETCNTAWLINSTLSTYDFVAYFKILNDAQQEIAKLTAMANDLNQLATDYNADTNLKGKNVRCSGFNCANQFLAYANAAIEILGGAGYQGKLDNLRQKGQEMQNMFVLTEQMKQKEGLFARSFEVPKKFELSQATISVKREKLDDKNKVGGAPGTQSGTVTPPAGNGVPAGAGIGGPSGEGSFGGAVGNGFTNPTLQSGTPTPSPSPASGGGGNAAGNNILPNAQINETIQLGRPRFMLSGGMAFSPLKRQTFKSVKGFVLNAQGEPTGTGNANVIGYEKNSPRRLLPMVLLNSRLLDHERSSLFFSFGITAKNDGNLDLDYLVGPSVSFLNDRALFTFGAYGGLTQNLVADLNIGDELSDDLGDAKLYRKSMTWKPGFSFSYSFSKPKKRENPGTPGTTSADELRNEIRIGGVPFNLALGLAYTSLEQRTYDEIAGLARDRQGNLTNGHTLARIVGLTSSSSYRLTPVALLHTRLTNFGSRDFYFTTGVTGRKTDNDLELEYLLGGTTNIYKRRVFLTFGTFIGRQQILGGNFFEGSALAKTQNVTTIDRYVWKPAISLSYDISKVIPR